MNGVRSYRISRMAVSLAFGLVFYLAGATWWLAILAGGAAMAWFLWAPQSGRYRVGTTLGAAGMRRDERGQVISDRAARNGFASLMLATATLVVYAALSGLSEVPILALSGLVILGMLTYFGSDFWLRRRI